ncbi:OLC1v1005423C1 [Oldenlandia corymbosa var. corymbosa]|uniref:OLC1v1005423C1 n=1 Tax=Oldenlandia corymbosa var. corymbosa TaxID=529605 RepID=A0AAV1DEJ0_OLDCO|nr:OLC1v1005423C1 [Oldenlandia corymbosa var. corymbosa]
MPIKSAALLLLMFGLIYYSYIFHPYSMGYKEILLKQHSTANDNDFVTDISHLLFGLVGSERECHHRKAYMESWWRPDEMRGYLFLDKPPTGDDLLPWSSASPPYRVSNNITEFGKEINASSSSDIIRTGYAIMEVVREYPEGFRWLLIGEDDTIFFVENILDVLEKYDDTKLYYFGGNSELVAKNFNLSFNMGFGGAGYIFSYPVAKLLAKYMVNYLRTFGRVYSSFDLILMSCLADFGVTFSPQKGMHQIDLRGNISGFLSSHTKDLLMSLHNFDVVEPIFPKLDRFDSTRHLMKAAGVDQSRLLQQTVCHDRQHNRTFSISWGYSIHIYEKIMPRSWLQMPLETFTTPVVEEPPVNPNPPHYMFNTRPRPGDNNPCDAPHVFYFDSIEINSDDNDPVVVSSYGRSGERGLPPCLVDQNGNNSADIVSRIYVYSPPTRRIELDRSECCDVAQEDEPKNVTHLVFRECMPDEIMA